MILLLTGCSEKSSVYPSGSGTYSITNQAPTGFAGKQGIRADAYKEAAAFCSQKGQDFEVVKFEANEGPYIFGKYPRVTLQFKCRSKQ
jgi:hypothetical protein